MSFFTELKRRNVFKVGVAYAIVAWLLIEVVATVFPILALPEWSIRLITVVIILGFPIAVFLAWAYELTPEGIKATATVDQSQNITHSKNQRLNYIILGLFILAVVYIVVENYVLNEDKTQKTEVVVQKTTPAIPEVKQTPLRLAILPFENLSPNPDNAFFADGLHEEILSTLSNQAGNIELISRTTMMTYRDSTKPLAEIARELHATHLLEGSVRREGDQVRLTLQLIDGRTDNHIWSHSYERTLKSALTLQVDVAREVAAQLAVQLTGKTGTVKPPTEDVVAYDLFLKGVTAIFDAKLVAARSYLDQALARDPGFAVAYAIRAVIYSGMINSPLEVIEDRAERDRVAQLAEEDARKALALNPDLGGAHSVLAGIHIYHWRWKEARAEFERALELSPNDPGVIAEYATHLALLGNQGDEVRAWQLAQHATELDPKSSPLFAAKGLTAISLGKFDEAAESFRESIALNPAIYGGWGYFLLGVTEYRRGDANAFSKAVQSAEQLMLGDPTPSNIANFIGAYRRLGNTDKAEQLMQQLKAMAADKPVSAMTWFIAYHGLGDQDQALDWLHKAIDTKDTYGFTMRMMAKQRNFPDLWDNPRFQEARHKVGFTD